MLKCTTAEIKDSFNVITVRARKKQSWVESFATVAIVSEQLFKILIFFIIHCRYFCISRVSQFNLQHLLSEITNVVSLFIKSIYPYGYEIETHTINIRILMWWDKPEPREIIFPLRRRHETTFNYTNLTVLFHFKISNWKKDFQTRIHLNEMILHIKKLSPFYNACEILNNNEKSRDDGKCLCFDSRKL